MIPSRLSRASVIGVAAVVAALAATPTVAQAPAPSPGGAPRIEKLAAFDEPWGMAFLPDGALLVTEKQGRLRRIVDGRRSEPIAGVPAVAYRDQGGLLDVAVSPGFGRDQLVFISFSEAAAEQPGGADVRDPRLGTYQELDDAVVKGLAVARARLVGDRLENVRVIWRAPKTVGRGHFGGRLAFADGHLLITSGDRQRFDPSQDRASGIGKVIRIRPDGTMPTDNPIPGGVWSLGHRNPLGIAVERGTGRVWLSEMGPLGGDEINLVQRGGNYGWPVVSEGDHYDEKVIPRPVTRSEFQPAVHTWTPVISPSGLVAYDGALFPSWRGQLLVGGLSSKALIRVRPRPGGRPDVHAMPMDFRVRDVEQAPDGSVMLLSDGPQGGLYRLTPVDR